MRKINELNPTPEGYYVTEKIYYEPQKGEIELALSAFACGLHLAIDGPTGSGKSTFAKRIAYLLGKGYKEIPKLKSEKTTKLLLDKIEPYRETGFPLYLVSCNEDLAADDLIGREVGMNEDWLNGQALLGAKHGGIIYLDEPAEARKDTLVVIHPLADERATVSVPKLGYVEECKKPHMIIMTYNSMYQDPRKKFKPSTAQRFIHEYLGYPEESLELKIIKEKTGIDTNLAKRIIMIAKETRNLAEQRKANIIAFPDYRVGIEDKRLVDQIDAELERLQIEEGKKVA